MKTKTKGFAMENSRLENWRKKRRGQEGLKENSFLRVIGYDGAKKARGRGANNTKKWL